MSRLFSRHQGRHRRHGSLTGWAALAQLCPVPVASHCRVPFGVLPVVEADLIPFTAAASTYLRPYSPKDAA